jgi:hypothetical protein
VSKFEKTKAILPQRTQRKAGLQITAEKTKKLRRGRVGKKCRYEEEDLEKSQRGVSIKRG